MITGGLGADQLTGGTGADRFIYTTVSESTAAARDLILDFNRGEGDKISLTSIDANANAGGNQNFTFIGSNAFSGVAGQLRYEIVDGRTLISADVNGDRVADLQIELNSALPLVSADFLL
jgi:Ca2+-binding RTX toxin-like protein